MISNTFGPVMHHWKIIIQENRPLPSVVVVVRAISVAFSLNKIVCPANGVSMISTKTPLIVEGRFPICLSSEHQD